MPISNDEYNALADIVRQGKVAYYRGRSASSLTELDANIAMAETAIPEGSLRSDLGGNALPMGWSESALDYFAERVVDKLIARMEQKDAEREAQWQSNPLPELVTDSDAVPQRLPQSPADGSFIASPAPTDEESVDSSLPDSPLNSMPVATLRGMAQGYGIENVAGMKKSDIIRAIEAKQAETGDKGA